MKKSTKKTLASLIIILIFGMSSIAYVISTIDSSGQQQAQTLNSTVVEGRISDDLVSSYIQNTPVTFMMFYYSQKGDLYDYVAQLPDLMSYGGQPQLVVARIPSNETQVQILNHNGEVDVTDLTQSGIYDALCQNLLYTPVDCLLQNLTIPPAAGEGNASQNSTTLNQTPENLSNSSVQQQMPAFNTTQPGQNQTNSSDNYTTTFYPQL